MAGFIDRIREGAEKAAFEADRLRRVTGAQSELRALIRRLEADTAELGRRALALHDAGTLAQPELEEACSAIDDLRQEIADKELQVQRIKEERPPEGPQPAVEHHNCPSCHVELPRDATFCPRCGTRVGDKAPAALVPCPNCGTPIPAEAEFCPECGQPAAPRPGKVVQLPPEAPTVMAMPADVLAPPGTKRCPFCHASIPGEAVFCPECGLVFPTEAEELAPDMPTVLTEPAEPEPVDEEPLPPEEPTVMVEPAEPEPVEEEPLQPEEPTLMVEPAELELVEEEPLPPEGPEPSAGLDLTPAQMPVAARTCPHCDASIPEEAVFCPECGQYIAPEDEELAPEMPTVLTEPESPPELDVTPAEAPVPARTCPHCDASIPEEAVFCPECGQYIAPEAEELAAEEPTILTEPAEPEPVEEALLPPEEPTLMVEPAEPELVEEEPLPPEGPESPPGLDQTPAEMPIAARICPHCSASIPEEALFCPECGLYIEPEAEAEELAPEMPTVLTEPAAPEPAEEEALPPEEPTLMVEPAEPDLVEEEPLPPDEPTLLEEPAGPEPVEEEPLPPDEPTLLEEPAEPELVEEEPLPPEGPEPSAELDLTPAQMPVTARTCPHCGASIPEEAVFCPECGQYIAPEAEEIAAEEPTILTEPAEPEPVEEEPLPPEEPTLMVEPAELELVEEEPLPPEGPESPPGLDQTPAEMPVAARTCPHCEASIPEEAVFCPECGQYIAPEAEELAPEMPTVLTGPAEPEALEEEPLPPEEIDEPEPPPELDLTPAQMLVAARICPHCSASIPQEALFCPECGLYIEPEVEAEELAPEMPTVLTGPAEPEALEEESLPPEELDEPESPPGLDLTPAEMPVGAKTCPHCGASIPEEAVFCPECGLYIEPEAEAEELAPEMPTVLAEPAGVGPAPEPGSTPAEMPVAEVLWPAMHIDADQDVPLPGETLRLRRCPSCQAGVPYSVRACPECGHVFAETPRAGQGAEAAGTSLSEPRQEATVSAEPAAYLQPEAPTVLQVMDLDADVPEEENLLQDSDAWDKGGDPVPLVRSEPRVELTTCPHCLGFVRVDAQFCPTCRQPLTGLNPAPPASESAPPATAGPGPDSLESGPDTPLDETVIIVACTNCGASIPASATSCPDCGAPLVS